MAATEKCAECVAHLRYYPDCKRPPEFENDKRKHLEPFDGREIVFLCGKHGDKELNLLRCTVWAPYNEIPGPCKRCLDPHKYLYDFIVDYNDLLYDPAEFFSGSYTKLNHTCWAHSEKVTYILVVPVISKVIIMAGWATFSVITAANHPRWNKIL
jgi:hypothetical protein